MKTTSILMTICIVLLEASSIGAQFEIIKIASSPNPVGSGARAIGMGGAFIASADDATAASWNPGGLIRLNRPEMSIVAYCLYRNENKRFIDNPVGNGSQAIFFEDLNYLSATYPLKLMDRNIILSLNYQHLYDFNKEYQFPLDMTNGKVRLKANEKYNQKGGLSTIGMACCIQIIPDFAAGVTLNFWHDDLTRNHWEESYHANGDILIRDGAVKFAYEQFEKNTYSFKGVNYNIGLLWRNIIYDTLSIGLVYKSPFRATLFHKLQSLIVNGNISTPFTLTGEGKLEMPMSFGLGVLYKFSDQFKVSTDFFRTEWDDLILQKNDGRSVSLVTGIPVEQSDVKAGYQVRMGTEFLIQENFANFVVPVRAGLFYESLPTNEGLNDCYGISFGFGYVTKKYAVDIAWQFRVGKDISLNSESDYSQDLYENVFYSSLIKYF